ncbi:hypothetical protein Taro_056298, partial [Colocasia esculenta]|nr:hypothetical protein [Colocasia esculenta]
MGEWRMGFALLCLQALLILIPPQGAAGAGTVPAIIVFGDSTVDAGNNNRVDTVLKSNFRPYGRDFDGGKPTGRFCNGRLATDFISEALGLRPSVPAYLDPEYGIADFAAAVCFASAGTGYDNATSDVLSVIPLWKELEYFKEYQGRLRGHMGEDRAAATVAGALFIVSAGTNDFLENYYATPRRSAHAGVEEFADFLVGLAEGFVTEIYRLGARKVALTGLAPIGCLPLERSANLQAGGGACVERYNEAARGFNAKLRGMCERLRGALPELRLVYSHVYDVFLAIIQNPSLFGESPSLLTVLPIFPVFFAEGSCLRGPCPPFIGSNWCQFRTRVRAHPHKTTSLHPI